MAVFRSKGLGWVLLLIVIGLSACLLVRQVNVEAVNTRADSVRVRTPVKAHMIDGSSVVYTDGVLVLRGRLVGAGTQYDLTLGNPIQVQDLSLDSVVGLESFRTSINAGASIAVTLLADVGGGFLVAAAAVSIFGSCPTYYADSAGIPVLEAEGFSYSIGPLFESRDVDRLRAQPDAQGVLRLEVRNEAFETHYINQLELLEVTHAPGEFVVPDPLGYPLSVAHQTGARAARDRAGRDVRGLLADADGHPYTTERSVLAGVTAEDPQDWLELGFDVENQGDSVALVLRLRNSLLNTVLLYDVMLGDPGARSLDWQAQYLSRVGPALELGSWYADHMGLGVEVWRDSAWVQVARLKDTGPVAWKDVAVPLPRTSGREMRVRLRFPADNWRIDRITLAGEVARPPVRALRPDRVTGLNGAPEPSALASVLQDDERYLQTQAGQAFIVGWDVRSAVPGVERTFLLASQGYYIEWVRRGWIAAARDTTTFQPNDAALLHALTRYRQVRDTLERRFFATRVPVR